MWDLADLFPPPLIGEGIFAQDGHPVSWSQSAIADSLSVLYIAYSILGAYQSSPQIFQFKQYRKRNY